MDDAAADNARVMKQIREMLGDGLKTEFEPFPETEKEFDTIVQRLRQLAPDDIEGKLVVGGFLDHPWGPERLRCMECINFLVNRRWCDLPELMVPVEPEWYCKLWRI